MKKICLIAFWFFAVNSALAAFSIDLFGAASLKGRLEEKAFALDGGEGGLKIALPCVDGRFYWNGNDFSYGVAFNSEKLNKVFPVQVKWGKLSVGGGLSKLNNPLISTSISPFSSATSTINPVTASLSSSFNKTDTLFFQVGYKKPVSKKDSLVKKDGLDNDGGNFWSKFFPLQNAVLNCYYDPNGKLFSPFGNVAASSFVAFGFPKKMKLSAEITFGSFFYKGLAFDSWYSDSPFFHEGRQNSAAAQLLFSTGDFSTILTGGFYGSPFGNLKTIWKTENKIKIAKNTIGFSVLFNPSHNLMTPSGKVIDECLQGKISFQYQARTGKKIPLFWKPGFGCFYQRNLAGENDELKLSCGLQFLCFLSSASIAVQSDFSVLSSKIDFSKGTVTLKNQWYFSAIQPGLKLTATFTPSSDYSYWKTSEVCVLYLSFCENPAVSLQCGGTFSQKDGDLSGMDFEFSGTVKFAWKKVKCTGKVSVEVKK